VSDRRTYVLDTSALLSDPLAFSRFGRHDVVIPVVVLDESERSPVAGLVTGLLETGPLSLG
tara:strand:- start:199 stop:381 length:183 start_codon:yes stop_codon:yes gene_type:complete